MIHFYFITALVTSNWWPKTLTEHFILFSSIMCFNCIAVNHLGDYFGKYQLTSPYSFKFLSQRAQVLFSPFLTFMSVWQNLHCIRFEAKLNFLFLAALPWVIWSSPLQTYNQSLQINRTDCYMFVLK